MTLAYVSSPTASPDASIQHKSRLKLSCSAATTEIIGERVKVFVRVRPAHPHETSGALEIHPNPDTNKQCLKLLKWADKTEHEFEFDDVLPPASTQQEVYRKAVEPIVDDVMQGFNGTVIAYGQTGAGKTHTLSSVRPHNLGMMPRAAADIFRKARADPLNDYLVTMSYIQIYMELIQDLFNPSKENLTLRENESGVYVAGATEIEVQCMEDCLRHLAIGERNRSTAFTAMNAHSSRSHAIVILTVVKRKKLAPSQQGAQKVRCGKLFLVDLAGSERLKKSGSTGLRATEAKAINLSLSMLGMCVAARADGAGHVPFRSSKLTRLLQESLGGNSKTSMVIAVADAVEHGEETLQSLHFASRAMCVKNAPVVNEAMDYKMMNAELLAQLDSRDANAFELETELTRLQEERDALQQGMEAAQQRLDSMSTDFCTKQAELNAQLLAQSARLTMLDAQKRAAESQVQALETILQQEREQLAQERQRHSELQQKLDAASQGAEQREQKRISQDGAETQVDQVTALEQQAAQLQERAAAAESALTEARSTLEDVCSQLKASQADALLQQQTVELQHRTIANLEQQLEQLKASQHSDAAQATTSSACEPAIASPCTPPGSQWGGSRAPSPKPRSASFGGSARGLSSPGSGSRRSPSSGCDDSVEAQLAAVKADLARRDERIERLLRQVQVLQDSVAAVDPKSQQRRGLFSCLVAR